MLRSRMFTPLFRLFAAWAAAAFVAAFLFSVATGSSPWYFDSSFPFLHNDNLVSSVLGPVTVGWKGDVGNHVGYVIWLAIAGLAAFLATMMLAFRDADPEAEAQAVHSESVPLTRAPSGASYWPVIGAAGAGTVIIGWVSNSAVFYAGLGVLVITAAFWTFRAWADRATGDDEVNRQIYHRWVDPIRIPVLAILAIGLVVFGVSRVLLAVSKTGSIVIFGALGALFFAVCILLALVPQVSRALITTLVVIAALALLIVGIVAAAAGSREFEEHHEGGGSESSGQGSTGGGTQEGGLAPATTPSPFNYTVSS